MVITLTSIYSLNEAFFINISMLFSHDFNAAVDKIMHWINLTRIQQLIHFLSY